MKILMNKPIFQGVVLVCEDNIMNQKVIQRHLSKIGLDCIIADNGKIGTQIVKEYTREGKKFDLILMDIQMPIMDGLTAADKLMEMNVKTPIIAMTANAVTDIAACCFEHGMSDFLEKPFPTAELWECLMKFLKPVKMVPLNMAQKFGNTGKIIDESIGIERSAEDETLYANIKKDFLRYNKSTFNNLRLAIDEDNIVLAHRICHSLKNTAALVGAVKLQVIAMEVEQVLAGNSSQLKEDQMLALKDAIDEVLNILQQQEAASDNEDDIILDGDVQLDKAVVKNLFDALIPMLQSGDSDSIDYLDEIKIKLIPLKPRSVELADEIYNYNFDNALAIIDEIKDNIGIS